MRQWCALGRSAVVARVDLVNQACVTKYSTEQSHSYRTRGQDYKEKQNIRLRTNLKLNVLEHTKLRHF